MISVLPDAPNKLADPNVFRSQVDSFFAALPRFISECNSTAEDINYKMLSISSLEAQLAESVKQMQALQSQAYQAVAAATFGHAKPWDSLITYSKNEVAVSNTNNQVYRCKLAVLGNGDPSTNTTNWTLAFQAPIIPISVIYTNATLAVATHSVVVQGTAFSLPSAAVNESVLITNTSASDLTITGFIGGESRAVTVPIGATHYKLSYSGTVWGWV